MANHLDVLASGKDGFTVATSYVEATQTTWFFLRSYMQRDGAGSFMVFQCKNLAGEFKDAVAMNPGLLDGTPGKENSDLDFDLLVDGKPSNISFAGRYRGSTCGIFPDPPNLFDIGNNYSRFRELWLTEHPPRPGMPPQVKRCIKVNGGYVPIYD